MKLADCNPFVRFALLQPAVLEGEGARMAYDHRLFCILENEGTVILADRRVPVAADDLLFIPPKTGYYFQGKMKVAVLNFDLTRAACHRRRALSPVPAEHFRQEKCFDPARAEGFERPLVMRGDPFLREQMLNVVTAFNEGGAAADAASSAAVKLLLADLVSRRKRATNAERALAERVYGYVRLHAPEIPDNAVLGAVFGYHPVYVGEVFRRQTGKTLHRAILEERLRLACRWLLQTDRSIEQIAADTGFSSRSHFCTAFRRAMGVTPLAYRRGAPRTL